MTDDAYSQLIALLDRGGAQLQMFVQDAIHRATAQLDVFLRRDYSVG
jgi:hypothetical protein